MNKKLLILLLAVIPMMVMGAKPKKTASPDVSVTQLRVENMQEPLGIGTDSPRFSWVIESKKQNVVQTAYQLVVSDDKGEVWNSGRVETDQQLWVKYGGEPLKSAMQLTWKLKVWTNVGESEWSSNQRFGIGLLTETHWNGRWIGLEQMLPGEERGLHTRLAARYVRHEFKLDKPVKRAIAYVAGVGLHELHINGKIFNEYVQQPIPSDYRKTIYYNTYDITPALAADNCIGLILGNGRYFTMRQNKPWKMPVFGLPKCRISVVVEFEDGTVKRIATDEKNWRITANGPIRSNNEYDGEEYDARQELSGWDMPGFNDKDWLQAERAAIQTGTLRAQPAPGMKMIPYPEKPQKLSHDVYDFKQNMAGWIAFTPNGNPGDTIRVKYAERLNPDGTLYRENLRDALTEDIYICGQQDVSSKQGRGEWHPIFATHGWRYAQVTGPATNVKAYTVSDEMRHTGTFECSDTILNKVMKNAWWGIYSNYKGFPVDCPQRNERQPWLGDRGKGCWGESFLFDNERLYTKWMNDICESQREDGVYCDVAPPYFNYYNDDVTWPAVLPFACDMLWRQYGNREAIDRSYPSMKRWIEHLLSEQTRDGIINKDTYGDWCMPPEKLELIHAEDPNRKTDGALISTAYLIQILQLMEQWGCDADHWRPIREKMTEAFNKKFLIVKRGTSPRPGHVLYPDSVYYGNNTVTANILPLAMGIVPEDCREDIVKQVVQNICVKNNGHISCGLIGISWLMQGLSDNGYSDVAWMLATQRTYPSWGYMTENGATTIWELWNGDKANPKMNSGNHVMLLGDLLSWCYQYIGGIKQGPEDSGNNTVATAYKHIILKPAFDIQNCFSANVSFDAPYGKIVSQWKKNLQHVDWHVAIPCNTTADICLPDGTTKTVGSGEYDFSCDIPTRHPAIVKDEFLYDLTYFPEAHASTITELKNGDLVAGYFGGTHERNPDVCIWVHIKKKGQEKWSAPILAADGVLDLNDARASLAGLTGMTDDTTPAVNGPIRRLSRGKAGNGNSKVADELTYDYVAKQTRLTGIPSTLKRKACWNPVLYEMPNGELWLFFKIGSSVGDWTGWVAKSKDGGRTWSDKEPMGYDPEGRAYLGPIKNKPELINGRLLCPSSTEKNGWRFHMEILDLNNGDWKKKPVKDLAWKWIPVESTEAIKTDDNKPHPIDCIQPSILKLKDGRLQVMMRTHNAKLATSFSSDEGDTWTPVVLSEVENNQSGTDAVTLNDGRHVLIYNNFETLPLTPKGVRTPCSIALSDDGQHWQHVLTLEDCPIDQYSYPAIIQGKDGTLHCTYTWRRQKVAYKQIDLNKLKDNR